MLLHFRVFKELEKQNKFLFKDPEKLKSFLKCLVPLLLWNLGGHSFHEFMYPLRLKELQDEKEGFPVLKKSNISNETVFFEDNEAAFNKALIEANAYNKIILQRAKVRQELCTRDRSTIFSDHSKGKFVPERSGDTVRASL